MHIFDIASGYKNPPSLYKVKHDNVMMDGRIMPMCVIVYDVLPI
jgi:hypothetical protein